MLFHSCFPLFFWFIRRQQRKTLISYYFHRIQRWKLHIHMIARNWKLLHYTYNHHHLVDMSIIDCKLSFGCLIIWNLILCVSSSRTRYKIQEPSWLSRVRCEVMSLKLLHFYIDYRPSCVFMWVVVSFRVQESWVSQEQANRSKVCVPRKMQTTAQHNIWMFTWYHIQT